jgi:hypothetical protein
MTLSTFTLNDRRRLQHYLNLPIQAVREGSTLWQACVFVEQIDSDEGTTIAADIQTRLGLLEALDSVNNNTSTLGDAIQSVESQASMISIPNEISLQFPQVRKSKHTGTAQSIINWMDELRANIRRDMGLSQQMYGNRIPTAYPGGGVARQMNRPSYGGWWY